MKTRKISYLLLFALFTASLAACDGIQRDPLEEPGGSTVVRPAVNPADTVTNIPDTVAAPSMEGDAQ